MNKKQKEARTMQKFFNFISATEKEISINSIFFGRIVSPLLLSKKLALLELKLKLVERRINSKRKKNAKRKIKIILPNCETDFVSDGLRLIVKKLGEKGEDISSGFLGGDYGYPPDFENNVFMIHHYCWCEEPTCNWCNGTEPNFLYKPTGFKIDFYKYIGRSMRHAKISANDWEKIVNHCIESIGG